MPVPRGFFELSPLPGALGPFGPARRLGAEDPQYPVFVRYRLYWGFPGAAVPEDAAAYPAPVLYGGPAPRAWAVANLGQWVAQWALTHEPRTDRPGTQWLVAAEQPALLVPAEAVVFPWRDFRWIWLLEHQRPDVYQIEGTASSPEFRNLRTGQTDRPGPLGDTPTVLAGEKVALVAERQVSPKGSVEADELDRAVRTWVTDDYYPWASIWPLNLVDDDDIAGDDEPEASVGAVAGWSWYVGRQLNTWRDPPIVGPWVVDPKTKSIYHWLRNVDAWQFGNSLVTGQLSPELSEDVYRWTGSKWVQT